MQAGTVTVTGRQILIAGQPFFVKGVCYAPTPIGETATQPPYGDYFTAKHAALHARDLPRLRAMGANCVRVYSWEPAADHSAFLDAAFNNGKQPIYVLVNRWIDPGTDWSNPNAVAAVRADYRAMALQVRDHPALLGYAIGNELNRANGNDPAFWAAVESIAAEIAAVDPDHVITLPLSHNNALFHIQAHDGELAHINVWAVQIYQGTRFGTFFDSYAQASGKPLLVTEFGMDAWDHENGVEFPNNAAVQAETLQSLWSDLVSHSNIVSGGMVFEWCDEWWKAGSPNTHDPGGWSNSHFPDGYADEEWWGLNRVVPGSPDTLQPRQGYWTLRSLWWSPAGPAQLTGVGFDPTGAFITVVQGTPGYSYAVESSSNMTDWVSVHTNVAPYQFVDPRPSNGQPRFYRAVLIP